MVSGVGFSDLSIFYRWEHRGPSRNSGHDSASWYSQTLLQVSSLLRTVGLCGGKLLRKTRRLPFKFLFMTSALSLALASQLCCHWWISCCYIFQPLSNCYLWWPVNPPLPWPLFLSNSSHYALMFFQWLSIAPLGFLEAYSCIRGFRYQPTLCVPIFLLGKRCKCVIFASLGPLL